MRETRYVWDGHVIVHELGGEDDELITWRFEPETFTPIAKERGERRWAIASDHLGTPAEMVDELGKLAWKMQLDVLGVPAFEEGDAEHCPFRWPGQYEDEETVVLPPQIGPSCVTVSSFPGRFKRARDGDADEEGKAYP